jgi:hypothetical protein
MSKRPYYFIISNGYTNYIIQSSQVRIPNDTDEVEEKKKPGRKGLPNGEERKDEPSLSQDDRQLSFFADRGSVPGLSSRSQHPKRTLTRRPPIVPYSSLVPHLNNPLSRLFGLQGFFCTGILIRKIATLCCQRLPLYV